MSKHINKNNQRTSLREERHLIERAARKASSTAVRISTALQLPIHLVQGDTLVLQEVDGRKVAIKKIHSVKSNIALSKGVKICLQPKD